MARFSIYRLIHKLAAIYVRNLDSCVHVYRKNISPHGVFIKAYTLHNDRKKAYSPLRCIAVFASEKETLYMGKKPANYLR